MMRIFAGRDLSIIFEYGAYAPDPHIRTGSSTPEFAFGRSPHVARCLIMDTETEEILATGEAWRVGTTKSPMVCPKCFTYFDREVGDDHIVHCYKDGTRLVRDCGPHYKDHARKYALARAMEQMGLSKATRTDIWREYFAKTRRSYNITDGSAKWLRRLQKDLDQ